MAQTVKNLPTMWETQMIPGLERSPGGGNGNPLQYSCFENSVDRGAWWAPVYGVAESELTERLTHFNLVRSFTMYNGVVYGFRNIIVAVFVCLLYVS